MQHSLIILKKLDGDQTVTLDTIMSFKRIKKLSADADTVRNAINQSAIVHVCEDGNRVGRIEPLELEASREEVNDSGTGEEPLLLELSGLAAIVLDDSDDSDDEGADFQGWGVDPLGLLATDY